MREQIEKFNQMRGIADCSKVCHAPSQSLYFGQTGAVVACCYNRNNILGRYPEESILDIWTGRKAEAMRKGMELERAEKRLPPGCEHCTSQLTASNFEGLHAKKYDKFAAPDADTLEARLVEEPPHGRITMPRVMEFELSNACNLECVMCHGGFSSLIRKNRELLPPLENPYDEDFVHQLEAFIPHLEEAKFLGGEPFLIKIYYDIWDRMVELKPDIVTSITTNGSILNKRIKGIVEQLDVIMVMSIDSIVRETYDKIRINSDFDQVEKSIAYYLDLCQRKGRRVCFATCPMILNWREIPGIVEYCNANEITLFINTVFHPRHVSLRYLSASELQEVAAFYREESARLRALTSEVDGNARGNLNGLNDLANQVDQWRKEALEMAEVALPESGEEPAEWLYKTEDHLRAYWRVAEVRRLILEEWEKPDPAARNYGFLADQRAEYQDDYSFMCYYLYGAFLAYVDTHDLDVDARRELRAKVELLFQNWENYSDRGALIETFLAQEPAEVLRRAAEAELDTLRYKPMLVIA